MFPILVVAPFLSLLNQGLEPKIPDCAEIIVCWIVWVITHVIVMLSWISVHEADLLPKTCSIDPELMLNHLEEC